MTTHLAYATDLYYRESGRFSFIKLPVALVVGLLGSILAAAIYAVCDLYSPLIYLNVALTIGFGVGAGAIVGQLFRAAEVRNRAVRVITSVVIAVGVYYVSWVVWLYALLTQHGDRSHPEEILQILDPTIVWRLTLHINRTGAWSIGEHAGSGGSAVNGWQLWIVWIIEAAIIFFGFLRMSERIGGGLPYCEACGQWAKKRKQLFTTHLMDLADLRGQLEAKNFAPLITNSPAKPADSSWLEVWTHSCDQCQDFNTMTIKQTTQTVNKKGQLQKSSKVKISHLLLSTVDLFALEALREAQKNPPRAQPPIVEGGESNDEDSDDETEPPQPGK